jgi:hypothetical protein
MVQATAQQQSLCAGKRIEEVAVHPVVCGGQIRDRNASRQDRQDRQGQRRIEEQENQGEKFSGS